MQASRARRVLATTVMLLATAAYAAPSAGAKTGPKITPDDACTIIATKQVGKAFGKPVVLDPAASLLGKVGCNARVGVDVTQPPGGVFTAFQDYPNLLSPQPSARASVSDRRAVELLSDHEIEDVNGVGLSAYLNRTTRGLTVLATKKYAFTVGWNRAGATTLTNAEIKKLKAIAHDVVKRAP